MTSSAAVAAVGTLTGSSTLKANLIAGETMGEHAVIGSVVEIP